MTPGTPAVVRDAIAADAEAVAAIGRVAFPLTHAGILHPLIVDAVVRQTYTAAAVRRCIEACAADPGAHFLVAASKGRILGYLHYDRQGAGPELHRIYIEPQHAGRGFGTSLLAELHRRLPSGATYRLMTAADNAGALRFYQRHGFTIEAEVEGLAYYREHMGVAFPVDAAPVPSLVLIRRMP
jgi:ribosomal protein S18 acetylase RimI-like enzyme